MFGVILVSMIIIAVVLFSVQNAMPVTIAFFAWRFDASLAIVSVLFFLAGMATGMGLLFWMRLRRRARKRRIETGTPPEPGRPSDAR